MRKASSSAPVQQINLQGKWVFLNDTRSLLILIIACIVCYGNTAFNNYSLDDDFAVTQNAFIQKGLTGIPDLLTHPYATTGDKSVDYRPVTGITFAIEQQLSPHNPHLSHLVNLLLFVICVLLIFKVLKDVFGLQLLHPALPLLIALFYAVHPSHTEVVASIKSRDEILSFSFMLMAFLSVWKFYTSETRKGFYAVITFLMLLLSYTSKMTSMPVIPIIILTCYYLGFYKKQKTVFYIFSALIIAFSVAYFAVIIYFLKRPMYDLENPLIINHDVFVRIGTSLETLFFYFKFLLVPYPSHFYYGYNTIPLISLSDPIAFFSLLIHAVLLSYGLYLFLKRQILGLLILCYFISIFLYSNLIILYPGIVSERLLFLPSLWFIACALLFIFRITGFDKPKKEFSILQRLVIGVGVTGIVVYTWLTIQRNFQWKDTITLMSSDIDKLSNSTLANYFYASVLQGEAEKTPTDSLRAYYYRAAKHYYRQAIHISPSYSEAHFKMGMILEYVEGKYDSAFDYFSKAYPLDTTKSPAQFQLAKSYFLKGNNVEANKLFAPLYQKMPTDTFTLFFYARSKYFSGDTATGFRINRQLIKIAPTTYYGYWNEGLFLREGGRWPEAVPYYEQAIRYGYGDKDIFEALHSYYLSTGQTQKIEEFRKIVEDRVRLEKGIRQ